MVEEAPAVVEVEANVNWKTIHYHWDDQMTWRNKCTSFFTHHQLREKWTIGQTGHANWTEYKLWVERGQTKSTYHCGWIVPNKKEKKTGDMWADWRSDDDWNQCRKMTFPDGPKLKEGWVREKKMKRKMSTLFWEVNKVQTEVNRRPFFSNF